MPFFESRCNGWDVLYGFVRDIFVAAAISCFLYAMHRAADGIKLGSDVRALREFGDVYAPEEREILIHKIKAESLRR